MLVLCGFFTTIGITRRTYRGKTAYKYRKDQFELKVDTRCRFLPYSFQLHRQTILIIKYTVGAIHLKWEKKIQLLPSATTNGLHI